MGVSGVVCVCVGGEIITMEYPVAVSCRSPELSLASHARYRWTHNFIIESDSSLSCCPRRDLNPDCDVLLQCQIIAYMYTVV